MSVLPFLRFVYLLIIHRQARALMAEKCKEEVLEGKYTEAEADVLATLSKLRDPRKVLLTSGVSQLLDHQSI